MWPCSSRLSEQSCPTDTEHLNRKKSLLTQLHFLDYFRSPALTRCPLLPHPQIPLSSAWAAAALLHLTHCNNRSKYFACPPKVLQHKFIKRLLNITQSLSKVTEHKGLSQRYERVRISRATEMRDRLHRLKMKQIQNNTPQPQHNYILSLTFLLLP